MKKLLVVAAHPGDVLWRCAGAVAKHVLNGGEARVIVLCYGLAGEAQDLLEQDDMTMAKAKGIRDTQLSEACKILRTTRSEIWDFEEYPFEPSRQKLYKLARALREYQPDLILTHHPCDPANPDHGKILSYVMDASEIANGSGVQIDGTVPGFPRPQIYCFEPHVSEASGFEPNVYIDITEAWLLKEKAMNVMADKKNIIVTYTDRARVRANNAKVFGRKKCDYAEAYHAIFPFAQSGDFIY